VPKEEAKWKEIAVGFNTRWNFPSCAGAMDGKHISIKCPSPSGSQFYNYKGNFSTILLAIVDSNYCFIHTDVGNYSRASDGGGFAKSAFKSAYERRVLNVPEQKLFVVDGAFPLQTYILKPYSHHRNLSFKEKIFNCRPSRARRIVENAFGILASRFRVFERPLSVKLETVDSTVRAITEIHNWLRKTFGSTYVARGITDMEDHENGTVIPGNWREVTTNGLGLMDITGGIGSNNYSKAAEEVGAQYAEYFVGDAAVSWQEAMIR
jgi:hypothetical protein